MGKASPSQNTNTVTQAIPAYLQAGQQQGIAYANNLANAPFQPYTGQAVAPFSPDQLQYFQGVQNAQGAWAPTSMASQNVYGNIAGGQYTPQINQTNATLNQLNPDKLSQGVSNYYDPAVSKEIGGMQAAIGNQNDIQNASAGRQAGMQGAYGGSGSALLQAQNNKNADLAMGQYTSQLLPQVYQQALNASGQDISNRQNALTTMGQQSLAQNAQNLGYAQLGEQAALGSGQLALGGAQALEGSGYNATGALYNDANQIGAAGTAQQTEAQNQLNFPLSQYNTALSWPYQQMSAYDAALGTAGQNPGMSQTTSAPYSPLTSGIGTGLAAIGTGANLYSAYNSGTGSARGGRIRGMRDGGALHFDDGGGLGLLTGDGGGISMGSIGSDAGTGILGLPTSMAPPSSGAAGLFGNGSPPVSSGAITNGPLDTTVAPTPRAYAMASIMRDPDSSTAPTATGPTPVTQTEGDRQRDAENGPVKDTSGVKIPSVLDKLTRNHRLNDLLINVGAAMMSHGSNAVKGIGQGIIEGGNATVQQQTGVAQQGYYGSKGSADLMTALKSMSQADQAKLIQQISSNPGLYGGIGAVQTGGSQ